MSGLTVPNTLAITEENFKDVTKTMLEYLDRVIENGEAYITQVEKEKEDEAQQFLLRALTRTRDKYEKVRAQIQGIIDRKVGGAPKPRARQRSQSITVKKLREKAKKRKIIGYSTMTKAQLLQSLQPKRR